jgi:hypothetical protein
MPQLLKTCRFDINIYGCSGTNSYGNKADCFVSRIVWSSLRGPRYYSAKDFSGYSQYEAAGFDEIPVHPDQRIRYKIVATFRAKYAGGAEKYFEIVKYAHVYPRDAGRSIKVWLTLKSWNIPIPPY